MPFDELPKPADYTLHGPDPSAAADKDIEMMIGLGQARQQQQLRNLQAQEIQQKLSQQQIAQGQARDFYQQYAALAKKPGGPTTQDISDLMGTPGALPHIKELQDRASLLSDKEKAAKTFVFNQAHSALYQKKPDIAQKVFEDARDASKNSGMLQDADMYGKLARTTARDPGAAILQTGTTLNTLDPNFQENFGKQVKLSGELEKQAADVKTAKSGAAFSDRLHQQTLDTGAAAVGASNAAAEKSREETTELKGLFPGKKTAQAYENTELQNKAAVSNIDFEAARSLRDSRVKSAEADARLKVVGATEGEAGLPYAKDRAAAAAKEATAKALSANITARDAAAFSSQNFQKLKAETDEINLKLTGLPEQAQKYVLENRDKSIVNQAAANRLNELADTVKSVKTGPGSAGWGQTVVQAFRKATGKTDPYSALLDEIDNTLHSEILNGASSHGAAAIIELRKMGYPSRTASGAELEPFIRTLAKARQQESDIAHANAMWTNSNPRNALVATKGFDTRSGYIPPGTSYDAMIRKLSPGAAAPTDAPSSRRAQLERKARIYGGP